MAAQELDEKTLLALQGQSGQAKDQSGTQEPLEDKTIEPTDKVIEDDVNLPDLEFKLEDEQVLKEPDKELPEDEGKPDQNTEVDTQLREAGFDVEALAKELAETGALPAEKIADLKTKMDPALVDAHLARITAEIRVAALEAESKATDANAEIIAMNDYIYKSVGGEDNFKAMAKVLGAKTTPDEQASINAKLSSGNKLLVQEGMKAAVAAYNKVKGMGGKLMSGDAGNVQTQDVLPHVTKEAFRKIVVSDKYKTDPAYAEKMDQARMATAKADKASYGPGQYFGFRNGARYEL